MSTPLKDLAIQCALQNNWQQAVLLNKQLIQENPNDIESLNRLAFAYMKLGEFKKAKNSYKKVIVLDKTNPIALKNLKKLETISNQSTHNAPTYSNINVGDLYIEEAGRTKTVDLKNIADKKTLSLLQPGDEVKLAIKRSKVFVQTQDDKYVGMLPEDMGTRLITFMKGGNQYLAFAKAIEDKSASIFIKETKKATRFKNQPSFPSTYPSLTSLDND